MSAERRKILPAGDAATETGNGMKDETLANEKGKIYRPCHLSDICSGIYHIRRQPA